MSDWTVPLLPSSQIGVLAVAGVASPATEAALNVGTTLTGTGVWPTANLALFLPVIVQFQVTVTAMAWWNGATVSGNADAGIYDRNQNLLVNAGSTAQTPISSIQTASVTSTTLPIGLYYLALVADNVTGIYARASSVSTNILASVGCAQMATSGLPLPSTATFAKPGQAYLPAIAAQIASAL